jgi:hypothetical protein
VRSITPVKGRRSAGVLVEGGPYATIFMSLSNPIL